MKIAVVGSLWLQTPPKKYGGTEEVIGNLVNGLTTRGHEVTYFGPQTAKVNARIIPIIKKPLREAGVAWEDVRAVHAHTLLFTEVFRRAQEFDVIHVHLNKSYDYMALPLAEYSKTPVLFTMHFALPTKKWHPERLHVLEQYKYLPFTTISNVQRKNHDLNFIKTVYNSLNLNHFPFSRKTEDYVVWLGKVKPEKGTKEAILAARKAGVQLYLMGAVDQGVSEWVSYFEKEVKPLVDGKKIVWLGEADIRMKVKYLKHAKALLNPIQWEEPFGLVMAEAQAVGTPVISFKRGAAPEVIQHKKTGFLVKSVSDMADAIHMVHTIDRAACRANIAKRFTIEQMVGGYEDAYKTIISEWKVYRKSQKV